MKYFLYAIFRIRAIMFVMYNVFPKLSNSAHNFPELYKKLAKFSSEKLLSVNGFRFL